ncbi:MAG: glycerol-3-phosphate acyltransferase [candidate division KSB1 bacterium]|jgi:glycerol-3-phosphate acyltransferase PlsY|nr:glycerol-3-phosphate acyltransferase [candidate division KSB1 bacterium]
MSIVYFTVAAIVGYLFGSLSSARFVVRLFAPDEDLSQTEVSVEGSDKKFKFEFISATTVSMHLGSRYGFMTMILDMFKIIIPALMVKYLISGEPYFLVTAAAGMMGHIWPLYYGFRGGRGLLAAYGGMFAVDWIGVFATFIMGMVFGLVALRDVLVAYLSGILFFIPWLWFRTHDINYVIYAVAVNIIMVIATIPEIRQWRKITKEDEKWKDPSSVLNETGMGRGIMKIAKLLGVMKKDDNK